MTSSQQARLKLIRLKLIGFCYVQAREADPPVIGGSRCPHARNQHRIGICRCRRRSTQHHSEAFFQPLRWQPRLPSWYDVLLLQYKPFK